MSGWSKRSTSCRGTGPTSSSSEGRAPISSSTQASYISVRRSEGYGAPAFAPAKNYGRMSIFATKSEDFISKTFLPLTLAVFVTANLFQIQASLIFAGTQGYRKVPRSGKLQLLLEILD